MFFRYLGAILMSLLSVLQTVLIVRAICSWIPPVRNSKFFGFLQTITEPLLAPIRALLHKISWLRNLPIDFSLLVLFIMIEFAITLLAYLL
ncbi:MAG: YggT family protein [Clostridia bacterium]|nr:YggT family protein [Clostridia bacterium]